MPLLGGSCLPELLRQTLLSAQRGRNITFMTKPTRAVLAEALRLGEDERAELAAEILASLDGPADHDSEQAWADEIKRRIASIEAGSAQLEPWDEVRRRIEKEILGR
jgi:putative addiction module component (TIGR02574 family)